MDERLTIVIHFPLAHFQIEDSRTIEDLSRTEDKLT